MSTAISDLYEYRKLLKKEVGAFRQHDYYCRWARQYLNFCTESSIAFSSRSSQQAFLKALTRRGIYGFMLKQAEHATELLWQVDAPLPIPVQSQVQQSSQEWERALIAMKQEIALRHYAQRTAKIYTYWSQRFQKYVKHQSPQTLTEKEVKDFLGDLAVKQELAASTQNQAFNALLFFFKFGLKRPLQDLKNIPRGKRHKHPPVLLSKAEIRTIFEKLEEPYLLIVQLLYGCGLRLKEALSLRCQDIDLIQKQIYVRRGKGGKDRILPMPENLVSKLQQQLQMAQNQLERDRQNLDWSGAFLPKGMGKKSPKAAKSLSWQWLFPAKKLTLVQETGKRYRHHLHTTHVQKNLQAMRQSLTMVKRVSPHSFRHAFASHLLSAGTSILTIQKLLGHSDVRTTMVYLHLQSPEDTRPWQSPIDSL